jgi:hypothetical protein
MKQGEWGGPSNEHEGVYHAASRCQAASLPLTPRRLHGLKKACSIEGKKTGGFASQRKTLLSCCMASMQISGRLKSRRSIGFLGLEHGENDPRPDVGEGTNSDTMTFPLAAFALVIGFGPGFLLRAVPGEGMQGIAQRFDTSQAAMRFRVRSALKQNGRGASQRLQTRRAGIPSWIIADFGEQARGQAFPCSRQTAEDLVVFWLCCKIGKDVVSSTVF